MRRLARAFLSAAALCLAGAASASTVYGMREHFDTLGAAYAAQSASSLWTFHDGSYAGSLLTATGSNLYAGPSQYQQIGVPVDTGTSGCTAGFCPANPATSLATFNGVFVHPGAASATVAVFHAQQALTLDAITLLSETVGNGNNGDGFAVTVRAIVGGIAQDVGSFDVDYASTLNDHGNMDLRIAVSPRTGELPEPQTLGLALAALAALGVAGRRRA